MLNIKEIATLQSHLAKVIKGERLKQGLSMYALAKRAELSQPMVGLIEQEKRTLTLSTFFRIAAGLKLKPDTLMKRARRAASEPRRMTTEVLTANGHE